MSMLSEIAHVRQIVGEPRRRWFQSENFDLFIWQDGRRNIVEFELCYDKRWDEHAVRWAKPARYGHYHVDDGEGRPGKHKASPILLFDRHGFDRNRIAELFQQESGKVEEKLATFIVEKILQFPQTAPCGSNNEDPEYMFDGYSRNSAQ